MSSLGKDFDAQLKSVQSRISKENAEVKDIESDDQAKLKHFQATCHPGFSVVFDNIDLELKCKNMSMSKQNKDEHWINHKMVTNRVSGNHLSSNGHKKELLDVPNIQFLPSLDDHNKQRHNYIVIVSRILVKYL